MEDLSWGKALLRGRTAWVPIGGAFFAVAFLDLAPQTGVLSHLPGLALAFVRGSLIAYFFGVVGAKFPLQPSILRHAPWLVMAPTLLALSFAVVWLDTPPTRDSLEAILRWALFIIGTVVLPYLTSATGRFGVRRARSYVIEYSIWALVGVAAAAMFYWCVETFMIDEVDPEYLKLIPPLSATVVIAGIGWLIATYSKRRDNAIEMTRRLASPEMHVSRRVVDVFLTQVAELHFLDDAAIATIVAGHGTNGLRLPRGGASLRADLDKALAEEKARRLKERMRDIRSGLGASAKSGDSISIETHLSSLMAFYELLYSLAREGAIEVSAVRNSFGQRIAWIFVFLYEAYHGENGSYRFVLEKFEHLQLLAKPRQVDGFRADWKTMREDALEKWRTEKIERA